MSALSAMAPDSTYNASSKYAPMAQPYPAAAASKLRPHRHFGHTITTAGPAVVTVHASGAGAHSLGSQSATSSAGGLPAHGVVQAPMAAWGSGVQPDMTKESIMQQRAAVRAWRVHQWHERSHPQWHVLAQAVAAQPCAPFAVNPVPPACAGGSLADGAHFLEQTNPCHTAHCRPADVVEPFANSIRPPLCLNCAQGSLCRRRHCQQQQ